MMNLNYTQINNNLNNNLNNKNYVFLNNINCSNKDDRYNFITFGANLYCLVKGLKELPTLAEDNKYA